MSSTSADRAATVLSERYRIERELGSGGMAIVYLAYDLRHDRKVAIKILRAELAAVLGADRFLSEIKTTAALQHPHILALFDSGQIDSELFYVMPFVDGESLRDRLTRERQLPIDDAVRIAREVADALGYAHAHGVVHRDIKPENILLQGGHALVADFGIALAVQSAGGMRLTETGLSLGTPQYMSPEQALAERSVDGRSDIYSLGAVLYEMLAGEPPFSAPTGQALVAKVLSDEPRPLAQLRRTIPAHLDAAVRQALDKIPADRFSTAAEFAAALANPSFSRATSANIAPTAAPVAAELWRRIAIALAASVVLLLGALLFVARSRRGSDAIHGVVRAGVYLPENQLPHDDTFGAPTLAISSDGQSIVYDGPGVGASVTRLWLRRWNQLSATPIAGTEDGQFPVFSPDGKAIAFASRPLSLKVTSLVTGLTTTVADTGLYDYRGFGGGVAWGADGMLYAVGTTGLIRVSPKGGVIGRITTLDTARDLGHMLPDILPNGRGALVTIVPRSRRMEEATIGVVSFATGVVDRVFKGTVARYVPPGFIVYTQASGALMAVPFDQSRLAVTGQSVALGDTAATIAVAQNGDLLYARPVATTNRLVLVDRRGAEHETWPELSGAYIRTPRLSPDGSRLAVSLDRGEGTALWVARVGGGTMTRITFDGMINERESWSPDGQRIIYPSDRTGGLKVFERRADGSGQTSLVNLHDPRRVFGVEWAPGGWLVFRTDDQAAGNADIMGIRPGVDSVPRAFVATQAEELTPAISLDGHWLAYTSNQTGRREIFVRPFPDTDKGTYQVSSSGGEEPVWSHDGRELFYRDASDHLVSVPILPGAGFEHGAPRVLFDASPFASLPFQRNYDVMPDGQRFVMIRSDVSRTNRMVMVFGFPDELRAKTGK